MSTLTETARQVTSIYVDVFGGDLLRYVIGAGGVYLLINLALASHLSAQKIGNRQIPPGQLGRELRASLRTVAIFAATGTAIALGAQSGLFTIYARIADYGTGYLIVSTALLILLHDAWFYWTHRAMHYPPLFRRFHRLHHRSHRPTPFTSYSFDVGEAVVNSLFLPLILLILPAHPLALLVFVVHMMLRNALAHCGYEIFPARPDGRPLFGWMTTVTHHDMHHAHAGKNLGFYFTWWDRWMGTEHPDYHAAFRQVGQPLTRASFRAALVVAFVLVSLGAGGAMASDLKGRYAAPGLSLVVEFAPCSKDARARCGTIVWVWDTSDIPHARVGDVIMPDLNRDGAQWKGHLQNPRNGWVFKGTITPDGPDLLRLKGCAGPICKSQTWRSLSSLARMVEAMP